jgi:hypothetical protein
MPRRKLTTEELLLQALRDGLAQLENVRTVGIDDPALSELKEHLRQQIKKIESKTQRRVAAD